MYSGNRHFNYIKLTALDIIVLINPLGSKVFLGCLRCSDMPWHLCFFKVA